MDSIAEQARDSLGGLIARVAGPGLVKVTLLGIAMKAAAWISFGATAAAAAYADRIRPNVDKAAQKMHELSGDITGAIKAYRDGDLSGSKRFV